jgi:hypothetical protein
VNILAYIFGGYSFFCILLVLINNDLPQNHPVERIDILKVNVDK